MARIPRRRPALRGASDAAATPTARERVLEFLRERPGQPWCAACLATKLDLARARVANVFLAAEGINGFRRHDDLCVACQQRRLGLVCVATMSTVPGSDGRGDAED